MLRNQHRDYMGEMNPPIFTPPKSQLDPKDERLIDLSETVGNLSKECEMLNEDNRRLEQDNRTLREENKELRTRNARLEGDAEAVRVEEDTTARIIKSVENSLKEKK